MAKPRGKGGAKGAAKGEPKSEPQVEAKSEPRFERFWRAKGWIAEIVENEEDDGWAVEMRREGDPEPVFVAPWVMGRNKKDPKPMNHADFETWVKSASEFLGRTQQQTRTAHRRSFDVRAEDGTPYTVVFDVVPDDYEPWGELVALDLFGVEVARVQTAPHLKLTIELAEDWVNGGFERPRVPDEAEDRLVEAEEEEFAIEYDEEPPPAED